MKMSTEFLNELGATFLPGYLGITVTQVAPGKVCAELEITKNLHAPNGFLHAGSVVTLADTCCGYGCMESLPEGGIGFTTIELKCNHTGTVMKGLVECTATAQHMGNMTQVWDASVLEKNTGKTIALFRCTQMILYKK